MRLRSANGYRYTVRPTENIRRIFSSVKQIFPRHLIFPAIFSKWAWLTFLRHPAFVYNNDTDKRVFFLSRTTTQLYSPGDARTSSIYLESATRSSILICMLSAIPLLVAGRAVRDALPLYEGVHRRLNVT